MWPFMGAEPDLRLRVQQLEKHLQESETEKEELRESVRFERQQKEDKRLQVQDQKEALCCGEERLKEFQKENKDLRQEVSNKTAEVARLRIENLKMVVEAANNGAVNKEAVTACLVDHDAKVLNKFHDLPLIGKQSAIKLWRVMVSIRSYSEVELKKKLGSKIFNDLWPMEKEPEPKKIKMQPPTLATSD